MRWYDKMKLPLQSEWRKIPFTAEDVLEARSDDELESLYARYLDRTGKEGTKEGWDMFIKDKLSKKV